MFTYALILLFIHYFVNQTVLPNHITSDMPLPHLFQIDLFLAFARAVPNCPLSGICKSADVVLCLKAHGGAGGK